MTTQPWIGPPGIACGVGSRKTPYEALMLLGDVAFTLAKRGWTWRSGAAPGADDAVESGVLQAIADGGQAIRVASAYSVPVYNLRRDDHRAMFEALVAEVAA